MSERIETVKSVLGSKYDIKNLITRGGMAEIYLGVHIALNKQVVIKIIRHELATVAGCRERFLREAKLAANLDHPVIINIYDFGGKDEFDYIIMPFIDGMTLQERIRQKGKLGIPECLRLVVILTDALCYAHNANVIHRDIKPSNIMIDKAGHIFLTDFGISKSLGDVDLTAPNSVLGTPKYISPEQIRGIQADKRSDLYSLGLVFYEMITGKHPFKSQDMTSLYYSHVHEIPGRPEACSPDIPCEVGEIIMKLLEKSPEQRYQDACDLLKDLEIVKMNTMAEARLDADKTVAETAIVGDKTKLRTPVTITGDGGSKDKGLLPNKKIISKGITVILGIALVVTIGVLWFSRFPEEDRGSSKSTVPPAIDQPLPSKVLETGNDKPQAEVPSKTTPSFDSVVNRILALGKAREATFLRVYLDKSQFAVGDPISYHFESDENCYLVVLSVTSSGDLVQIFPNKYILDQFVQANKKYTVPGSQSGIALEVSGPPGKEELVALAAREPLNLLPTSFESQPFFQVDRGNQGVLEEITRNLETAEKLHVAQKRVTYWIADDAG